MGEFKTDEILEGY